MPSGVDALGVMAQDRLRQIVTTLLHRPGHETVRALIRELLVNSLGLNDSDVRLEDPLPRVRGRIDALTGRTAIEIKSDLRREARDAEEKLKRYLAELEAKTGEKYIGIATDGAIYRSYCLKRGKLTLLQEFLPSRDDPGQFLTWLDASLAARATVAPEPETIRQFLGKGSLAWQIARQELAVLWKEVADRSSSLLRRELWAKLLEMVYGSRVDADDLFFQHTYLSIVAKAVATRVLGGDLSEPEKLLSGQFFRDLRIFGVVEHDFFSWVLLASSGAEVVKRIAREVLRIRLEEMRQDVLKGLYESLVDPEQRHDLGEYYTPDWLAARICDHAITDALNQKILDPACGSGTFLFHAVRKFMAAAERAGVDRQTALSRCCAQVRGLDIHPLAVQIARVTYLLALGQERLRERPALTIPVYLGDSLLWGGGVYGRIFGQDVSIPVNGGELYFPAAIAENPVLYDEMVDVMLDLASKACDDQPLRSWLARRGIQDEQVLSKVSDTYRQLQRLLESGRNDVWGYYARNLSRPIWLSSKSERSDVLVGNPPWLSYRFMSERMQERFRLACRDYDIWVGGKVATHQDLSAYFFVRCADLYLREGGTVAFVMPYAAINAQQYSRFRTGQFGRLMKFRFTEARAFDENVRPVFEVPCCVLFGHVTKETTGIPATIKRFTGTLPRKDATPEEAQAHLDVATLPWPAAREDKYSPYTETFKNGATVYPRVLVVVRKIPPGPLGEDPNYPRIESYRTNREKKPWADVRSLSGTVEAEFLYELWLGESVAPFRLLQPLHAVIPWDRAQGRILYAEAARRAGYLHLAAWLAEAERLWVRHGRPGVTLAEHLDHYGKLSSQFPSPALRVVYAASGSLPAAAILENPRGIAEHGLYWAAVRDRAEGLYLCSILNSEVLRKRIANAQVKGRWGARHFDKLLLSAPIPEFNPRDALHQKLVAAGERAERVASRVALEPTTHFVRARQLVRRALAEDGVLAETDALVSELLS